LGCKTGYNFYFFSWKKERKKEFELEWVELHKGYNLFFFLMEEFRRVLSLKGVEWSGVGVAKELGSCFLW
jgi:hypothetical protein